MGDVIGQDRSALYLQGGCFIATSRVVIHDLLRNIVDCSKIRGILVYNAHKITESSIEAFILRVYKQGNRNGFIKVPHDNFFCHGPRLLPTMQMLFVEILDKYFHFSPDLIVPARILDAASLRQETLSMA